MISQDQADALARQWVAAWNAHDLEGILAHYVEDGEFISPFVVRLLDETTGTVNGKSGCETISSAVSRVILPCASNSIASFLGCRV